jgi:hypothetical protein
MGPATRPLVEADRIECYAARAIEILIEINVLRF